MTRYAIKTACYSEQNTRVLIFSGRISHEWEYILQLYNIWKKSCINSLFVLQYFLIMMKKYFPLETHHKKKQCPPKCAHKPPRQGRKLDDIRNKISNKLAQTTQKHTQKVFGYFCFTCKWLGVGNYSEGISSQIGCYRLM